jgi:hypothetical protein
LERHYFVADETDLLANNLVHATTKFLKSHMIIYSQNRVSKLDKENIAISLSGGVLHRLLPHDVIDTSLPSDTIYPLTAST